jgi:RNA polymerase sigma-70 factor, ECF subfamily
MANQAAARSPASYLEAKKALKWPDPMPGTPPKTRPDNPQLLVGDGVNGDVSTVALSVAAAGQVPSNTPDAAALMLRVKAGGDAAFDFLVQKFRRQLIGFMYRMTHSQHVAEELAQEVFLRVYRSRESYSAEAKFTTWMYRIATNLALNHLRDTKTERNEVSVSLDEPDSETGRTPDVADHGLTAEEDLLRKERVAAIRKQVEALPERQRMAVLMHKYQAMDYKEISKVLKLSESATKSLLFRAYETLRETLKRFV